MKQVSAILLGNPLFNGSNARPGMDRAATDKAQADCLRLERGLSRSLEGKGNQSLKENYL